MGGAALKYGASLLASYNRLRGQRPTAKIELKLANADFQ